MRSWGAPQRPQMDIIIGALPLAEPFAALDANDNRMLGTINAMEEMGTSGGATAGTGRQLVLELLWWKLTESLAQRQHLPACRTMCRIFYASG